MLSFMSIYSLLLALVPALVASTTTQDAETKHNQTVSLELFSELEELSRLVAISYCVGFQGIQKPFTCLSHCSEFPGLELVQTWDTGLITNSCGYIALSHGPIYPPRILVVFRGTSSFSNFFSDLQTSHAEYVPYTTTNGHQCTNCTVHSGFIRAWNVTREDILPQLQVLRAEHPDYPIVLAGHSMGGAVAGIAGLELKSSRDLWGDVKVVTFGEPMFGNLGMARFVDRTFGCQHTSAANASCSYKRVTHVSDPVPLMPPTEWGWHSHGGEVYISKPDLPPQREDLIVCSGAQDPACIGDGSPKDKEALAAQQVLVEEELDPQMPHDKRDLVPPRWQVWQLLFAHREYIWRLGLCFDPDWPWDSRPGILMSDNNEL